MGLTLIYFYIDLSPRLEVASDKPTHDRGLGVFKEYNTLLKIKVIYWHQWCHKEPFPSMELFHSTKASLQWKRVL